MPDENAEVAEKEAQDYRESLGKEMWEDEDVIVEVPLETPDLDDLAEDLEDPKEEDPWANVNPLVKEKITELDGRIKNVAALEDRLKQAERRVGGLQNSIKSGGKRTLTAEQQTDIDSFKEDFPEFYQVVDHLTAAGNQPASQSVDIDQKMESVRSEMEGRMETIQLTMAYPDYQEQLQTPEYQKWLIDQKPDFKQLINSPKATDAIKVLNKYKADIVDKPKAADVVQGRRQRLQASQTIKGKSTKPIKAEADMNEAELRAKIGKEVWS